MIVGGLNIPSPILAYEIPTIELTNPSHFTEYPFIKNMLLEVKISNLGNHRIDHVEYYQGVNYIGRSDHYPYNFIWQQVAVDTSYLSAVLVTKDGFRAGSPAVKINVKRNIAVDPKIKLEILDHSSCSHCATNLTMKYEIKDLGNRQAKNIEFYRGTHLVAVYNPEVSNYFTWYNIDHGPVDLSVVLVTRDGFRVGSPAVHYCSSYNSEAKYYDLNVRPTIKIVSPIKNQSLYRPDSLDIVTEIQNPGNFKIKKVEYYKGIYKIGEQEPYKTFHWTKNIPNSIIDISAVLITEEGYKVGSPAVRVNINRDTDDEASYDNSLKATIKVIDNDKNNKGELISLEAVIPNGFNCYKVKFYSNDNVIGEDQTYPYQIKWENIRNNYQNISAKGFNCTK